MSKHHTPRAGDKAPFAPDFAPVSVRYRHDGCTPERQVAYIAALAECGCVSDAARRVGLSTEAVYRLARRADAQSFRLAWDLALDNAARRIADAAYERCVNGVPVPHYYRGELIGEHRRYDERLTMFLLRYRDPLRYGKHLDRAEFTGHAEAKALALGDALVQVREDALREAAGLPRQVVRDLPVANDADDDWDEAEEGTDETGVPLDEEHLDGDELDQDDLDGDDPDPAAPSPTPDVSSTSSTSTARNRHARRRAAAKRRKR